MPADIPSATPTPPIRIGIDTGGTFTDFVIFEPVTGELSTFKVPSTPHNPAQAVLEGVQAWKDRYHHPPGSIQIIHGSTVATNALLERKGAKTALITTKGFRDVLAIGRQNRPSLYHLTPALPPPIVPDEFRFEMEERVDAQGNILSPLALSELPHLITRLQELEVEAVAICFLFSFIHPAHEKILADALRTVKNASAQTHGQAGMFFVSASHEVLPEYREYERTATTVVNAYVSPIMDRYLGELETAFSTREAHQTLHIMQSNGGILSPAQARKEAVRCILSGPAGGLVAAQFLPTGGGTPFAGKQPFSGDNSRAFLTFDMGGTSTDLSLIREAPTLTNEAEIGDLPIRIPVLDIHTIGAGGGSIAWIDPGGHLRVGPQSAGADPGPACYGRTPHRIHPTVTDANLILHRLLPDHFLGGQMPLFPEMAHAAITPLAQSLGLTPVETALGIVEIANAHMARALRVISVERGHDPADFVLVSFGGAGGLHAADLARELSIPRVLVSPFASVFSALGMLLADVIKDYSQTVMLPGHSSASRIQSSLAPLLEQARRDLAAEGIQDANISLESQLDVRYRGQSYELTIPFTERWRETFDETYHSIYGYTLPDAAIDIVNLRVRGIGRVPTPEIKPTPHGGSDPAPAWIRTQPTYLSPTPTEIPVYDGEQLKPGNQLAGPALVVRPDTTILIGESDHASVDGYHNLILDVGGSTR